MQRTTATKTLLTGALGMILTGSLVGDITTAYYTSGSNYGYQLSQMPDFDQKRSTLPWSGGTNAAPGGMYCVPTSCMNLLGYMSTHGVSGVGPVFADWENEDNYAGITNFISDLGNDMSTNRFTGTDGVPAFLTMFNRVVWPTSGRYIVGLEYQTRSNVVTLREMSRSGIFQDAIQTVGYGFYDSLGFHGTARVIERTGGHWMTFTGSERSGTYRHMWANDPSNSSSWSTQANFHKGDWDTPWSARLRVASSLSSAGASPVQGMNRLMRGSSDQYRFIDSRLIVRPVGIASWGEWAGGSSSIDSSGWSMLEGDFRDVEIGRVPFEAAGILKMPLGDDLVIERFGNGQARLWRAFDAPGQFAPVGIGDEEGPDFLDFAISKDLGIFALATNGALYELPGDPETPITPETMRIVLDGLQGYDRVSTDPDTGMVSLINTREGFMKLADRYLEDVRTFDIRFIPAVSDQYPQIFGDFDQDGRTDMIVLGKDFTGAQSVNLLSFQGQQVEFRNITDQLMDSPNDPTTQIRGLATDDTGALLLNLDGIISAYDCMGQGEFILNHDHLFSGIQVGNGLAITRSFTNHDPRIHDTEGWNTQLDESETCPDDDCGIAGDLNGDNVVDGQDLATLLAAWDSDSEIADLDGDGRVSGPDLAILLGAYGS